MLFPTQRIQHGAVIASRRLALVVFLGWTLLAPRLGSAADSRGWAYMIDRLVADGLDRERVTRVFADPRMEPFDGLDFGLDPREPHSLYRGFLRASSVSAARRCRSEHAAALEAAEATTGVSADLVTAILYVETGCGRNTGSSRILYRLARLAMANEPVNLRANIARLAGDLTPDADIEQRVRARAQYLEDTFYPEVRAAFDVADRMHVDVLELRGSPSGAVGDPQFLPTNYIRYGADATGDGVVDLYDTADAAASCATYLADKGWRSGLTDSERRAVIWHYNRSAAYVDAVLTLARRIETGQAVPAEPVVRTARAAQGRKRATKVAARSTSAAKTTARSSAKTPKRAVRASNPKPTAPTTIAQGSAG